MLALLMIVATPAFADVISADGVSVDLKLPAEFCPLSRDHPVDRLHYQQQDQMQATMNGVLMLAVPCQEIEGARAGKPWTRWALWLLNGAPGKHTRLPVSVTRADAVKGLSEALPTVDLTTLQSNVNTAVKEKGFEMALQTMKVVAKDDTALFTAQVITVKHGATTRKLAAVTGWVAMKQHIYTLNTYRDVGDAKAIEELLADNRATLMRSVEATDALKTP